VFRLEPRRDHVTSTRIAAATGAVALAAGLIFAPSAFAADPAPAPQCADLHGVKVDCTLLDTNRVIVDTTDGALAGVRVGDTLCLRVEALSSRTTADVHLRVPCQHPIGSCVEAAEHGYHDVTRFDPRYRRYLDAADGTVDGVACKTPVPVPPVVTPAPDDTPVAPAPKTIIANLPVTH
jgi:hypothetical protein